MSKTIDQLNFQVVLDDREFDTKVKADIALAKELNTQLSQLLQAKINITKVSPQDAASAKRTSDILTKQATDQEKINQAKAKTAEAEEKVATQAAKTAKELERAGVAASQSYLNMKRAGTESQRTATEMQRTATAAQNTANATARAQLAQQRLANFSRVTTTEYQTQSRLVSELKGYALGYLSISGVSKLLSSLVRVTGEFELQKTTLAAMIGDLNKAEGIITRIQGLAVESPFQFKELTTYAKQLSAFSVPAQELYDTTKMLADISAGLGVGMDRIVLAYGQVRSAAFLRGQEVRQFTEAGIPILDELAKQFSELNGRIVTTAEVFDLISKRMVPFEMVAKVFKQMTSEGGKFYKMQEVQAETLKGKISNLKDAYEMMLNEIGKGQSENLKGAVDWARKLMTNYEDTGKALVELISTYGIYKAALIGLELVTNTFVAANHRLIASLVSAGKYLATNPYMVVAAGITAVGYAIYKNHTALEGFQKVQKSVASIQSDFTKDLSKESAKLDSLYAKLKLAKKGTQEYEEAKRSIYSQYAGYISELKAEGIEVSNLADIYGILKEKIEGSVKVRTSAKAKQRLNETYDQEVDEYYDKYLNIITKAQKELNRRSKNGYADFNEFEKAGFWKFITGAMNIGDLERTSGLERVVRVLNDASLDAATDLRDLRKAMMMTTREYEASLKKIKAAYGDLEEGTNGNIVPVAITPGGDNQAAIDALKKQVQALQTLKKEYDDWKELGVSDESLKLSLQGYFPNIKQEFGQGFITDLNFATRILEKIKELEAIAPEEAYNLKMSFGLDKSADDKDAAKKQIKAYEDVAEAANKYFNTLRKWQAEDFNIGGEGIGFDLSKIISDLNEKIAEIELRATKAREIFGQIDLDSEEEVSKVKELFVKEFGADAWAEFWTSYKEKGFSAIRDLAEAQRNAEIAIAQEKARDLGKKYAKELLKNGSVGLTELSDKTYRQLNDMADKVNELIKEKINEIGKIDSEEYDLTEEEKAKLLALEETIKELGLSLDVIVDEKTEKMLKGFKAIGRVSKEVVSSIKDIAGISEDDYTVGAKIAEGWSRFGDVLESAGQSGFLGLIVGIVKFAADSINDGFNSMLVGLQRTIEEVKKYRELVLSINRETYKQIAGTNELGLFEFNTQALDDAKKDLDSFLDAVLSVKKVQKILSKLELSMPEGGFDNTEDYLAFFDSLEVELAKSGSKLNARQKAWIQALIDNGKQLSDAATEQATYLSNLYSNVADDIADAFITAFKESGEAALDYGEIMEGIATQLMKDVIKKSLLEQVFTDENIKKVSDAINSGNYDKALAETEGLMQMAEGLLPGLEGVFEVLGKYLDRTDNEDVVTAADGIKGVTEDTANLLASYMNAIRADGSLRNTLITQLNGNVQQIFTTLNAYIPSLAEYQAQIAANTYDIATSNREILSELRGLITYDGGNGAAVKTYS